MSQIVTVIFEVTTDDRAAAEAIVAERLDAARLLWQNDSNDVANGTLDPINTFVVVPAAALLEDSI